MYQDNIRNVEESIKASLRAISVGSYVFQSGVASRLGLNTTDLEAIYRIGSAPEGLTAGQLSRELGLTTGATTTAIDRLVEAGYVRRQRDAKDGRRVLLRFNRNGSRRLRRQYAPIDSRIDEAIERLSPAQRSAVADFLAAIAQ